VRRSRHTTTDSVAALVEAHPHHHRDKEEIERLDCNSMLGFSTTSRSLDLVGNVFGMGVGRLCYRLGRLVHSCCPGAGGRRFSMSR
jgi:hypothetical protein